MGLPPLDTTVRLHCTPKPEPQNMYFEHSEPLLIHVIYVIFLREVEKRKGEDIGKGKSENGNKGGVDAKKTKGNDGGGDKQRQVEKGNAHDRGKEKFENKNKKGRESDKTKGNEEGKNLEKYFKNHI
uniref:Uncharacterized protein n=1 Tax=Lactuca sativa TaxID=4236 RepID=A0A9R1UPA6_LACSA|nr:hypothetical protein LSAT_V11C800391130 [Lactuca sativa]